MKSVWTNEEVETLKMSWFKGESATVIGALLKKTRNAIIGKVHRLSLERDVGYEKRKPKKKATIPWVPKVPIVPFLPPVIDRPPEPPPSPESHVSVLDVGAGQCRAIIEPSDGPAGLAVMCGAPVLPGYVWCQYHKDRFVYTFPPARR